MSEADISGTCEPAFAAVGDAFRRCFEQQGETGAAICLYHEGRPVVDLWGGMADPQSGLPWARDTLVHVYSVGKPFAAICLLHLIEQGLVDLDTPVAAYWPDFTQAGKADIPVRWLLSHQAGLLGIRQPLPSETILDWDRIAACLAAEAPWWPPGERHGEQAYFFGHLVGEVVRRVDGRTPGPYLREEVAGPWGLDFHFGLDAAQEERCATIVGMDDTWRAGLTAPGSLYDQALGNPPGLLDPNTINGSDWRRAEVPAVNGHATAHAVARFYCGLAQGGELDGVRLLSDGLVREACSVQSSGEDVLLANPMDWGLGFQIDADGFGMGGLGGSLGWGNADHGFGYAYVTHRMANHDRALAVYKAVADVFGFEFDGGG